MIPSYVLPLVEIIVADLDKYIESPYAEEMRGIARAAGAPLGDVIITNFFYELSVLVWFDARQEKTDLKVFVVVIPKQEWVRDFLRI